MAHLSAALQAQLQVNTLVGNPALGKDVAAIRNAIQQATPHAQTVQNELQAALGRTSGQTPQFIQAALTELTSAVQLGQLILTGPEGMVLVRREELVVHGGVALATINLALLTLNAGPSAPHGGHRLQPAELRAADGYRAEILANGLNFATVVEVAADGTVYVAEAGFSYGNITAPARVLRVQANGATTVVADGFVGPVAGLAVHDRTLFVSHRNTISAVDLGSGRKTDIITGLPSLGDHYNENIAIGPDGKLYITQGVATNAGVVGPDNYFFGWLPLAPQFHDIPCRDLTLAGVNYTTGNPLTADVSDTAVTGAYLPFGTPSTAGQVVRGEVKCSGAILRANLDGSGLEVFADGFRNNYGLAFHPDGRLFTTEQGPDDRGSRPVGGPDNFYEVVKGGWYGWPDFYGGVPVNDPRRKPEAHDVQSPVLLNPPPLARQPLAQFPAHATAVGFDFSHAAAFAPVGDAFVALFGDLAPATSAGVEVQAGQQVVSVTAQGEARPFLTSTAMSSLGQPVFRPTDATFDPSGQVLYVTHFGEMNAVPGGVAPRPGTGALIRITRQVAGPPALPDTSVEAGVVTFPETGYSLEGEFLGYWRAHGGLPVFGYPIDSARQVDGQVVQYLERARFERHPENRAPYNVLLGRLGVEALEQQGRTWKSFPKARPGAPHYFAETGHAIAHDDFWRYWSSHGLEFDGRRGTSVAESLALFGYPVSEPQMERNSSGDLVLTQWFERARFEYHPNSPTAYKVLLGRLGAEHRDERGR